MKGLHIVATGRYAPEKIVTNEDLSKIVDTSDEWISSRTGMKKRHFCTTETNITLAAKAAKAALDKTDIMPEEIGALIVATFSGEYFVPSVACLVQQELGLTDDMICYDLNAACSGFVFGLETVRGLLLQSEKKYAILIGSEVISKKLDMEDRGTCILFGDGAGAVVMELGDKEYTSVLGSRGDVTGISCGSTEDSDRKVHMDGQAIYKFAVSTVPKLIKKTAAKADLTLDDIDVFVCHQANARIIDAVARMLKQPADKFFMDIEEYGNTSAASIPLAISDMDDRGLLKPGMKIMMAGFGAGLTWGAVLLEW